MLKIAIYLRESNNFNSLMAVLAGINSSPILRLKQAWKMIDRKIITNKYFEVEKLMRAEKSFETYRGALKASGINCVPYL
jgi:hypothetical protein